MPRAASWSGVPSIKGSSETMRMALLTFSLVGLQFTWGIEMTYCTPYLLQLGLTKSHTSAVWIAGPLSGLVMQPLVGVIADNSRSKWGRRRPFIVGGSFIVAACLLVLGWASEIVDRFVVNPEKRATWTIVVAIASIYATDFSINAVQSSCRSLIVDTLPIPKQQTGSAWASRMSAVGHLIGYAVGTLNLRSLWGDWLGDTQFKQLCVIAGLALIIACAVTSYAVKERVLLDSMEEDAAKGAWHVVARIFRMTVHLPPRIQSICWIQFWAWIGWFPFLFYSPTWVGETYFRHSGASSASKASTSEADRFGEIGRIGSLSLFTFSAITLIASIFLPFLIQSPTSNPSNTILDTTTQRSRRQSSPRPSSSSSTTIIKSLSISLPRRLFRLLLKPLRPLLRLLRPLHSSFPSTKPSLLTAWLYSHFVFALAMLLAPFAHSLGSATFLVALSGLPWALAGWAPFAFMGVEINRIATTDGSVQGLNGSARRGRGSLGAVENAEGVEMGVPLLRLHHSNPRRGGGSGGGSDGLLGHNSDGSDSEYDFDGSASGRNSPASTGETAGIYLGILNLFTTLPQFIGTFISMLVFALFEPGPSSQAQAGTSAKDAAASNQGLGSVQKEGVLGEQDGGVNAIAVCLFIGGICSLGAAYATRRFQALR